MPKVRALCSAGITRPPRSNDPVRLPLWPSPKSDVEAATLAHNGSPLTTTNHPSDVLCPLPRRIKRVRVSITSSLMLHSPNGRRVCIRIVTFEACSGFTRVTARGIAQPPKVTFVTRLQSRQSPSETARQLPDLSTIIWVEPSSTDDSRLQGALPRADMPAGQAPLRHSFAIVVLLILVHSGVVGADLLAVVPKSIAASEKPNSKGRSQSATPATECIAWTLPW